MNIKTDFNLKKYNTFGLNVRTKYFAECDSIEAINRCLKNDLFIKNKKLIIGECSNILFSKNFDGFVLKPNLRGIVLDIDNEEDVILKVYCGERWDDFVKYCINNQFYGVENLSWIPGNVGSVPIQNIGAYGVEAKDFIESVEALNIKTGNIENFNNYDCHFEYRNSIFKNSLAEKYMIISVKFRLSKRPNFKIDYNGLKERIDQLDILNIQNIREEIIKIRQAKLPNPFEIGNAGSYFKNPIIDKEEFYLLQMRFLDIPFYELPNEKIKIPAGWLIEKCGLKGKRIGNVGTYKNQALIIVNYGNSIGNDILSFAEFVKNEVFKLLGIILHEEVRIV